MVSRVNLYLKISSFTVQLPYKTKFTKRFLTSQSVTNISSVVLFIYFIIIIFYFILIYFIFLNKMPPMKFLQLKMTFRDLILSDITSYPL